MNIKLLNKLKHYILYVHVENSTMTHSIAPVLMAAKELDAKGMFSSGSILGLLSLKSLCMR